MNKIIVILLLQLSINTSFAKAGGIGDGGGQAVVCRADDGSVVSAELLDIFEAKNYFLLSIATRPADQDYLSIALEYATILDRAIPAVEPMSERTNTSGGYTQTTFEVGLDLFISHKSPYLQMAVSRLDKEKLLIPGDVMIPAIGDSNPLVLPSKKGCGLEQIAIYKDGTNQVRFIEGVWDKLSNVSKSALLVHEALYRRLRLMGDLNSDRTRKLVGYLYSGKSFTWIFEGVPDKFLTCWTNDTNHSFMFVVYPIDSDYVAAQFLVWNNEAVMNRIVTQMDIAPFAPQFGLQIPIQNSSSTIREIKDPLLEINSYELSYEKDSVSQKINIKFEISAGAFSSANALPVECNARLTAVKYENGGVSIGPASP